MAANGVNLDALIPRGDFALGDGVVAQAPGDERLSLPHFQGKFFSPMLRKPEFQRETLHWSPQKVVDLVAAFLDRRLIPAVILWRAGNYNFVVDGAHRISALLAWIYDDYGDRHRSRNLFGLVLPPEQIDLANKTRDLMNKQVGSFELYNAGLDYPGVVDEITERRISNLSVAHMVAQWVPAVTKEAAEDSFFKINDAATPLEPTERRILRSRGSAAAIAARAIAHAGKGFPYWGHFPEENAARTASRSAMIFNMLYHPPLTSAIADTLDVPVAGKGYSVLPFVFDLVIKLNNLKAKDSTNRVRSNVEDRNVLGLDKSGDQTVEFLNSVHTAVARITGKEPTSLGLHPVAYFYTSGGSFVPWAFLAWTSIVNGLFSDKKVNEFCAVRSRVEEFLIKDKWSMSEIVHKNGSGQRSIPWLERYWGIVLDRFLAGDGVAQVAEFIHNSENFRFLANKVPVFRLPGENPTGNFSRSTKTAAIWESALPGAPRCTICGGLWHRNSIHIDHKHDKSMGGSARSENARVAHPYCDSTYKYVPK